MLSKKILYVLLLALSVTASAQVSQDLIDKAKAAGMTDEQIQQEISKRMGVKNDAKQSGGLSKEYIVTDRKMPTNKLLQSVEEQRENNKSKENLKKIVFGHEIFSDKNLSFSPELNIPTPKGYILSAGDEVLINVWGDSELNLKLRISPDGTIIVPNVGPVSLSGLTIEAAEDRIRQELGRIMSTLVDGENGSNTYVSVSLGQIRSMRVHIVGEAVAPGSYTLPSFATLFNALYAAGGVNKIGSLRSVKVYRNSKLVADLDVYDYLLNGKYDTNVRLEENDMIIIGPYESLVFAQGKVKRNRLFEMKKGETLQQLLTMTGGFTGDAYTQDVRVKRKSGTRYRIETVRDTDFSKFVMQDGDSLVVDSVIPYYENRLTITGAVWRPGEYELSPSLHTVKQLVKQAAGLKGDEFTGRAQITRLNPDFTTTLIAVNIRGILNGTEPDIELKPEDELVIPSLFDLREPYTIKVCGAVNLGDTILPYRNNLTVEDAIVMAGGLKESAASVHVEVARRIKDPTSVKTSNRIAEEFTFTLKPDLGLVSGDTLFTLEPFDEVYVRFSPGYQEQQVVKINGEVIFAGSYVLAEKNARLSDIIAKAGGITPDAYVKGANLKRQLTEDEMRRLETLLELSTNKQSRDSVALSMVNVKDYSVGIDLEKALANPGGADDVVLRDGDELFVPQLQSTVKISGAVIYPNSVTYMKGMSVGNYLSQAGGYNDIARKYPIVIYMNGKVATTHRRFIFFKHYPKVEPGCEILIPAKSQRDRKTSLAEVLSIASSTTSMAAMVTSIMTTISNNKKN